MKKVDFLELNPCPFSGAINRISSVCRRPGENQALFG